MTKFYNNLEMTFKSLEYKDLKQAYKEMKPEEFINIVEKEVIKLYKESYYEGGKQSYNLIKGLDYISVEELINDKF